MHIPKTDLATASDDAHAAAVELAELVTPEVLPLLASRRWAETLAMTAPRVASPDALGRDWHAHGLALLGLRRFAEGAAALDHSVVLARPEGGKPTDTPFARLMRAYVVAAEGRGETAIRRLAFERANQVPAAAGLLAAMAVRAPSRARLLRTAEELLSVALVLGHDDIAAQLAAGWNAIIPDNPTARFMLAATSGEAVPSSAPVDYLREHFDEFAAGFEDVLVGRLGYGTPQVMHDALEAWMRAQPALLRILDLGCGTGLCGPLFRPYASHLTGIDLAPRMVDAAAAKGCYDQLEVAEITEFLRMAAAGPPHDLIIATDVVMYFGEIAALLEAAAAALRPGGRFGLSVEAHDAPGHRLYSTGRYKHQRAWVERQALDAGFAVTTVERTTIRMEVGEPVEGWLLVLERPHPA